MQAKQFACSANTSLWAGWDLKLTVSVQVSHPRPWKRPRVRESLFKSHAQAEQSACSCPKIRRLILWAGWDLNLTDSVHRSHSEDGICSRSSHPTSQAKQFACSANTSLWAGWDLNLTDSVHRSHSEDGICSRSSHPTSQAKQFACSANTSLWAGWDLNPQALTSASS